MTALTEYTVTVTARDSTGTARGLGGDVYWIKIENQWAYGTFFQCEDVASQRVILTSEHDSQMYDNHDGTYTHTYTVPLDGTFTVSILLYTRGSFYGTSSSFSNFF